MVKGTGKVVYPEITSAEDVAVSPYFSLGRARAGPASWPSIVGASRRQNFLCVLCHRVFTEEVETEPPEKTTPFSFEAQDNERKLSPEAFPA